MNICVVSRLCLVALALTSPARAQECDTLPLVADVGAGTPGSAGIPELRTVGQPMVNQPGMGLRIAQARAGAAAQIAVGAAGPRTPLPAYGAQLYLAPPFVRFVLPIGPDGQSAVLLSGPAATSPVLCGAEFVTQGLVVDSAAQGGLAFTGGVRLRFGVGSAAASLYDGACFFTAPVPGWQQSHVLAAGDMNGDGLADVVAPGGSFQQEGTVRVLLQLYDGSLWGATDQMAGNEGSVPRGMVVTDLDDDGLLDVAIAFGLASSDPAGLSLLRGLGDGSLEPPIVVAAPPGGSPQAIVAADLSGDGLPELIVAGWSAQSVAVLPNLGGLSFGTPAEFALGGKPLERGLQLADVTGDGLLDFLLLRDTPTLNDDLVILPGAGGLSFGASQVIDTGCFNTQGLATSDIDGDGDQDIAFSGENVFVLGSVWWIENLGSGQFAAAIDADGSSQSIPATHVHLVDLDQDGLPELVYSALAMVWIQPNVGGSFGDWTRLRTRGETLVIADMNGDARPDLLTANESILSWVRWIAGLGDATFAYPAIAPDYAPLWTTAADLDADGFPDLLISPPYNSETWIAVKLGAGDGSFGPAAQYECGGNVYSNPTVVDLDADGNLDAVMACPTPGLVVVRRGLGDGTLGPLESYPAAGVATGSMRVVDLDSDGDLDIVARKYSPGAGLMILLGAGDGTLLPAQPIVLSLYGLIGVGDVDEDGHPDILYGTPPIAGTTTVQVLRGVGDGTFSPPEFVMPGGYPLNNGRVADVDLDGHLDLVLVYSQDELSVHLGAGNGSFALSHATTARFESRVDVADVNGDGAPDLVGLSGLINGLMLGFGDGTFAPVQPGGAGGAIADFDGDGDLDTADRGMVFLNALN